MSLALESLLKSALACSGPGARDAIESSVRVAWFAFAGSSIIALAGVWAAIRNRRLRPMALSLVGLAVAQPALWLDSVSGDCGSRRVQWALVSAACSLLIALTVAVPVVFRRPE